MPGSGKSLPPIPWLTCTTLSPTTIYGFLAYSKRDNNRFMATACHRRISLSLLYCTPYMIMIIANVITTPNCVPFFSWSTAILALSRERFGASGWERYETRFSPARLSFVLTSTTIILGHCSISACKISQISRSGIYRHHRQLRRGLDFQFQGAVADLLLLFLVASLMPCKGWSRPTFEKHMRRDV